MKFYSWSILIFCLFWCLGCLPLSAQNKVSKISVLGNQFVKEDGSKYIFRGLNTSDPERLDTMGRWNEVYFDEMKKWVDEALATNSLLVILFHGVGGGNGLDVKIEDHYKLLTYIKEKENEIMVAPMVDMTQHIKQWQAENK